MIEIATVALLTVVAIELGVLLWALARPLLALGRGADRLASIAEALDVFVARITGPSATEELRDSLKGSPRD